MSEEMMNVLDYSFTPVEELDYNHYRPIVIHTKKFAEATYKPEVYGQFYFGFKPELDEVDELLKKLQRVINYIGVKVDVRCYSRFSLLMQKVMYEFGCFENVMESSGKLNQEVRNTIVFPRPRITTKCLNQGPYYYVDMISAYSSCMTGIPHNLEPDSPLNTKIQELIEKMFECVTILKRQKSKLATTLKFMMNSCFGYSIKRPKHGLIQSKYTTNVDSRVEEMYEFVAKYNYKNGGSRDGFVCTVDSFHPWFNYTQFGKLILDNYNKKVKELEMVVDILYCNIDAFIVNESDYKKLLELGYIGDGLGQLKVEAIFSEVYFESSRKWMGKCIDGSIYCRPRKLIERVNFDEFARSIQK
jgi:hypothetical protein